LDLTSSNNEVLIKFSSYQTARMRTSFQCPLGIISGMQRKPWDRGHTLWFLGAYLGHGFLGL
jgi:hypothetical protein